jgi:hypothetical protein
MAWIQSPFGPGVWVTGLTGRVGDTRPAYPHIRRERSQFPRVRKVALLGEMPMNAELFIL